MTFLTLGFHLRKYAAESIGWLRTLFDQEVCSFWRHTHLVKLHLGQVWCSLSGLLSVFLMLFCVSRVIWIGGPKLEALLLTESQLKADLDGMKFEVLQEIERDVREGDHANNSQNNSHCNNDDNDGNGDDDEENRNNNHHHNNIIIIIITTIMIGILHTGHAAVIQCLGVKSG